MCYNTIGYNIGRVNQMSRIVQKIEKRRIKRKQKFDQHKKITRTMKEHGFDILNSENFLKTRQHIQHGDMSVHSHCLDVARFSLAINQKLKLDCNKEDLVRGALLHDYFLYDWHDKELLKERGRFHGFHHPSTALKNAEREYQLTTIQREIIRKHMWPLTVVPPMCREAWVVTTADKFCSLRETFGYRKGHFGHGKK